MNVESTTYQARTDLCQKSQSLSLLLCMGSRAGPRPVPAMLLAPIQKGVEACHASPYKLLPVLEGHKSCYIMHVWSSTYATSTDLR